MPTSFWVMGSSKRRPISRLMAKYVYSGLVTAWRLAAWPTRRSLSLVKATIEGVVRPPSAFSMTLGDAPSMTATQELVVPRSMPMTFAIICPSDQATATWPPPKERPPVRPREIAGGKCENPYRDGGYIGARYPCRKAIGTGFG